MSRFSKAASTALLCLGGLVCAATSCGKSSAAPALSPPLPPAEEPEPDQASAYLPDGGARPDEREPSDDADE